MNTEKEYQTAGYNFAEGAIKCIALYVLLACVCLFCINKALVALGVGQDDSDESAAVRSGMIVRTDYKTGVEYLESTKGFLIERKKHPTP